MRNLIPYNEAIPVICRSPDEMQEICQLQNGLIGKEGRDGILPELYPVFRVVELMHESTMMFANLNCSPDHVDWFLQSEIYRALCGLLRQDADAEERDVTLFIKTMLSTLRLNNNIDPTLLAETFVEIIRELKPSKVALYFTRISLRNKMTFVPTGKELRDTLQEAIGTLRTLKGMSESLPEMAQCERPFGGISSYLNYHKEGAVFCNNGEVTAIESAPETEKMVSPLEEYLAAPMRNVRRTA